MSWTSGEFHISCGAYNRLIDIFIILVQRGLSYSTVALENTMLKRDNTLFETITKALAVKIIVLHLYITHFIRNN